jgi:hypothetical protein
MKAFPDKLKPVNQSHFSSYKFSRELCKLRKRILEYMYSENKGGFDLKSNVDDVGQYTYDHIDDKLIDRVRSELHILGWKTKVAYGNTTLFIYEKEDDLQKMSEMEEIDC